jgi:hypothetical protein
MEELVEWKVTGETETLAEFAPITLRPVQMPHDLTWDRTWGVCVMAKLATPKAV